jgi:hypothetical protein
MRYDFVLLYTDDEQPGFSRFHLPLCCPANPDDEIAQVRVPKKTLVKQHMPERRFLDMGDAVRELMHDLCQRGPVMRKLRAEHPSWMRDMSKLIDWITGRKVRADAKGMMTVQLVMPREEPPTDTYALLKNQQR